MGRLALVLCLLGALGPALVAGAEASVEGGWDTARRCCRRRCHCVRVGAWSHGMQSSFVTPFVAVGEEGCMHDATVDQQTTVECA